MLISRLMGDVMASTLGKSRHCNVVVLQTSRVTHEEGGFITERVVRDVPLSIQAEGQ